MLVMSVLLWVSVPTYFLRFDRPRRVDVESLVAVRFGELCLRDVGLD